MLEVKRPGGAGATELQCQEMKRWHDAGAACAVVRSVDDARLLVGAMKDSARSLGGALIAARGLVERVGWEIRR